LLAAADVTKDKLEESEEEKWRGVLKREKKVMV
jgi:hypothetical protein